MSMPYWLRGAINPAEQKKPETEDVAEATAMPQDEELAPTETASDDLPPPDIEDDPSSPLPSFEADSGSSPISVIVPTATAETKLEETKKKAKHGKRK